MSSSLMISVVVPGFNEAGNIIPTVEGIIATFSRHQLQGEIILIDDGSQDTTWPEMQAAAARFDGVRAFRHPRNYGLSYALNTGFSHILGDVAIFLPADLQFIPDEVISRMIAKFAEGYEVVVGYKQGENSSPRSLASKLSSSLIRTVFRVPVRDMNAVRGFKREVVEGMTLRSEWHAFMIPIATAQGWRIGEVPVSVLPRLRGKSKFRLKSFVFAFFDLVTVRFILTFGQRPMLLFGLIAGALFSVALASAAYIIYDWFEAGIDLLRPLLVIGGGSFLGGLVLFLVGFLAELVVTQHELLKQQEHRLREIEREVRQAR